jgi:MFS family permease
MEDQPNNADLPPRELPPFLHRKPPQRDGVSEKKDWPSRFVEFLNRVQPQQEGPHAGPKVYGMTRRFSMRATMLLVAVAAGCMAILRSVDMPPVAGLVVLFLLFVAAASQMFMYGGKNPRKASVIAGMIVFAAVNLIDSVVSDSRDRGMVPLPFNLVMGAIFGALVGYVLGGLVAGVFLLLDMYDAKFGKKPSADAAQNIDPLADD